VAAILTLAGVIAPPVLTATEQAASAAVNETVLVDSRSPVGSTSSTSLSPGTKYIFTVSGTYSWGRLDKSMSPGSADAECSTQPPDTTYQRSRFVLLETSGDLLDVYVNGANVEWQAKTPDPLGCAGDGLHTYTMVFSPSAPGPVTFSVHDRGNGDNNGVLSVSIREQSEILVSEFFVNARLRNGVTSPVSLDPAKQYRIESSGTFSFGTAGHLADTECAGVPPAPLQRNLYGTILTPTDSTDDLLDLYVGNVQQDWTAKTPGVSGCDDVNHVYNMDYVPAAAGPVNFTIKDSNNNDNIGQVRVRIYEQEVASVGQPSQVALPNVDPRETVTVDSRNRNGTTTSLPLQAGKSYVVEASGTYSYGGGQQADPECSTTSSDPTWLADRTFPGVTDPDVLDLLVDGHGVDWLPTSEGDPGCNSASHIYRMVLVPAYTAYVNFKVNDGYHGDNGGSLTVKISRITEIPAGGVLVNSTSPQGANTSITLQPNLSYRFNANGVFNYYRTQSGALADAECSEAPFSPYNDPTFQPNRFGGSDLLDLYVDNAEVTWSPVDGSLTGCDANHSYSVLFTPATAKTVNLHIHDGPKNYADNIGSLAVLVFQQT
jgi:hypothetical protein